MAVPNLGSGGGGFQLSPGVEFTEYDLATTAPAVATTEGAIAGVFSWGPVEKLLLIDSENLLAQRYGKPSSDNFETWFAAANFLAYGNRLLVSRLFDDATMLNAVANSGSITVSNHVVKNADDYDDASSSFESNAKYVAKYPGALGNSLKVSQCDNANQYSSSINLRANATFDYANTKISIAVGNTVATVKFDSAGLETIYPANGAQTVADQISVGDIIRLGNTSIGYQDLKILSKGAVTPETSGMSNTGVATFTLTFDQAYKLSTDYGSNTINRYWEYYNQVDSAPGQSQYVTDWGAGNTAVVDELHVVITDEDGKFSGNPGTVLEVFKNLSRATDAKGPEGGTNYYKTVINDQSQYVWAASDRSGAASANALAVASATANTPLTLSFAGGADSAAESSVSFGALARAYDLFQSSESVDISLVLTGKSRGGTNGEQLANYLIDNIATVRRDCVVYISPEKADVVNSTTPGSDVVTFRNSLNSTSYAFLDSGYKYQFDKYNDVFRWVPLNGDIAGIAARSDAAYDPWFSPAGLVRGSVKNLVKLAFNPTKADRDFLYKNGVNPVVTFPGQGTLLYGDKTLIGRPSAFDRINVRRLFIVLEKSISAAAKSALFEFNDEFTRASFKNLVEPFLRDIQGRRGIYDYRVVCDETNNTEAVIDSNRFVGDIYVKPAKSINFIQLNFVAVRSGVEFTEIAGVV